MPKRSQQEIEQLYQRHVNTVYRVCYAHMKQPAEAEDAVQDTFIKLMRANPHLADVCHEKAWLIRTAGNVCKDMLRRRRRRELPLEDDLPGGAFLHENNTVLQAVLALPGKYKTVVVLYYYEGYNSAEIARLLRKPGATVRGHLHEARKLLKLQLGGELD